jgi:hypothetical protein
MLSEAELELVDENSESDPDRDVVLPDDSSLDSDGGASGSEPRTAASTSSSLRRHLKLPLSRRDRLLEMLDSLVGRRTDDGERQKLNDIGDDEDSPRRRG